jgi:hypothetical protein
MCLTGIRRSGGSVCSGATWFRLFLVSLLVEPCNFQRMTVLVGECDQIMGRIYGCFNMVEVEKSELAAKFCGVMFI